MATTKRMFSNDIVGSDAFLEMPTSTQALYFHLNMKADDDGFVNPKMIMRMVGCGEDDLKILIAKKFVIPFENGVVVVKHWLINNNKIQKDRYKTSLYTEQKSELYLKENRSYTTNENKGKKLLIEDCIHSVNNVLTQNRIEENRKEKKSNNTISKKDKLNSSYEEKFESWWKIYPRKIGKGNAYETWSLLGENIKDICLTAIQAQVENNHFYYEWVNNGKGGHNPPHPTTWLNQKRWDDAVVNKIIKGESSNVLVDEHSKKLVDNIKNNTIKIN